MVEWQAGSRLGGLNPVEWCYRVTCPPSLAYAPGLAAAQRPRHATRWGETREHQEPQHGKQ